MTTATDEIIETLNELIEVLVDGQRGFSGAADAVDADDNLLKSELMRYSNQWGDYAATLAHALAGLGEEVEGHGTIVGTIRQGWISFKQAIGCDAQYALLTECLHGGEAMIDAYGRAMDADLPSPLDQIVQMQYETVKSVQRRISALCEVAGPKN
jgi:uncharacterized protein (TIGR02284 family)